MRPTFFVDLLLLLTTAAVSSFGNSTTVDSSLASYIMEVSVWNLLSKNKIWVLEMGLSFGITTIKNEKGTAGATFIAPTFCLKRRKANFDVGTVVWSAVDGQTAENLAF